MIRNLIIYAALAVLSLTNSAQSQDLMGFDRGSFGSVVLSRTQAAGTDVQLELSIGSYENEPISNYKGTIFADIGRSVGRLDVLTDKGLFPCTAFIVSKKHILTNYHCSLGLLDNAQVGASRIEATQFVAGYTQTGVDEGTKKYTVVPIPVEFSEELDYAVLEVIGNPSREYGELKLASLVPNDRAPFWVIGHPQGKGQHISREKCRASTPAVSRNKLLHTCDTLPGNSGSPVIDAGQQIVVGLHYAGISNDSVNAAILMSKILENSKVLAAYKAPSALPVVNVEQTKTTEATACDALYSAAADAKACYAYEAYVKSCRNHSLAPIADGYIQEFCKVQEVAEAYNITTQICGLNFENGEEYNSSGHRVMSENKYTGQLLNDRPDGQGKFKSASMLYVGAWKNGLPAGQGELTFLDPDDSDPTEPNYIGQWRNGDITIGDYFDSNMLETYVGTFKNCLFNGRGTFNHADGTRYSGEFKDDFEHGRGQLFSADGKVLKEGVWEDGKFNKPKKQKCTIMAHHDAKWCSNTELCINGTRSLMGKIIWDGNNIWLNYAAEAKRRGLSCGTDVKITKKTCYEDAKVCITSELCKMATSGTTSKSWNQSAVYKKHVTEAKRRGLSCGVKVKPEVKNVTVKSIQSRLNMLGCNAGKADGILGPKTLLALNRWKARGGLYTVNKIDKSLQKALWSTSKKCLQKNSSTSTSLHDYQSAMELLNKNDFELAVQQFDKLITEFPDGPLVSGAHYYKGEAFIGLNKWKSAGHSFVESFKSDSSGEVAAKALYKLGVSLGKLQKIEEACKVLLDVELLFPKNKIVLDANNEMQTLGCR